VLSRLAVPGATALAAAAAIGVAGDGGGGAPAVDFARDVRPILSDRCFRCHGPDAEAREAGLRLDLEEGALADLGGYAAIVRGDVAASELWQRVSAQSDLERMPPPEGGEALSAGEIETLRRWIEEGAPWQRHWAFAPPVATPPPAAPPERAGWARDDLDLYVLARLGAAGLSPSPEADRPTLLRRLALDLVGVPPSPEELDAFLADDSADAYERAVERLLASPHFGERMALPWLDAARYADTNGYHRDATRTMWLWRDWLIDALNRNEPYDRMVVEMLAGDLLPDPTTAQLVATGFNRNHMLNDEGGAIPEEYQVEYVVDRVRTTATTFLGLTLACAQCHDHKYDPISQVDYYRFYSFFNRLPEKGLDGSDGPAQPAMSVPRGADLAEIERLRAEAAGLRRSLDDVDADAREGLAAREREDRSALGAWESLVPIAMQALDEPRVAFTAGPDGVVDVGGANPDTADYELTYRTDSVGIAALWLEVLPYGDNGYHPAGSTGRTSHGNWVISELELEARALADPARTVRVPLIASADYSQPKYPIANAVDGDLKTGWAVDGHTLLEPRNAVFAPADPAATPADSSARIGFAGGTELVVRLRQRFGSQHTLGRFRLSISTQRGDGAPARPVELGDWHLSGPAAGDPDLLFAAGLAERDGGAWERRPDLVDGAVHVLAGERSAFHLFRTLTADSARTVTLSLGSDDSLVAWLDGRRVLASNAKRPPAPDQERVDVALTAGTHELVLRIVNYGGPAGFFFRVAAEGPYARPGPVTAALRGVTTGADAQRALWRWYRSTSDPEWSRMLARADELDGRAAVLEAAAPGIMVMRDQPGVRMTRLLERGRYDRPGREVSAGVPAFLPPLLARADARTEPDRLDLARWMVQPDHPLTARVQVNRVWQALFGAGLVATPDDLGAQGEFPSHPELLDRLAVDFVASGFDTKALVRRIVCSATYRQSSAVSPAAGELDPTNRLLSRAPSFRLPAEHVRDSALFVAGLLNDEVGGPSVRPYQPPGLWEEVSFNNADRKDSDFYTPDSGPDLYRRGIYTFWKRALPPPSLSTFDAPTREVCTVRRGRTNTPLQALVLMNDPTYVEAARHLAQRALAEPGFDDDARLARAFRRVVSRSPTAREHGVLRAFLADERARFQAAPEDAAALLAVGESRFDASLDPAELAAWTSLCSLLLNLDEAITRR
jgi:hypothetical protein